MGVRGFKPDRADREKLTDSLNLSTYDRHYQGSKFGYSLADSIIREAIDNGVNFIDTAFVYN